MRYVIVPALLIALLAFACDDNGDGTTPTATSTAEIQATTATATPEPAVETLAFIRDGDIWLIGADGSNERRLNLTDVQSFTWISPDELDVVTEGEPPSHLLVDLEGNISELSFPAPSFWSPDARLVAIFDEAGFRIEDREGRSVWTGTLQEPPDGAAQSLGGVTWSRNGNALAYIDGEEIVILSGEPLAEQRLRIAAECPTTNCPGPETPVYGGQAFSPDGKTLVVPVTREGDIAAVGNTQFAVYLVDLESTPATHSLLYPAAGQQKDFGSLPGATFSPDGRYVAYPTFVHLSACEGFSGVTVLSVDGSQVERFVPDEITSAQDSFTPRVPDSSRGPGIYRSGLAWSPASDAIVAGFRMIDCSFIEGQSVSDEEMTLVTGLYVLHSDDFSQEKLAEDFPSSTPAWSPSGSFLAYQSGDEELSMVRVMELTSRRTVDIGPGASPAWRPQP